MKKKKKKWRDGIGTLVPADIGAAEVSSEWSWRFRVAV
jgi:hypothetical protein